MDWITSLIVLATFVSWGIASLIAKLATNRIGGKAVFWDMVGYAPAVFIYSLIIYKLRNLVQGDKIGIWLAVLSGALSSFGLVGWYLLVTKGEVSTMVPLTALYPVLTAVLAIVFLHESLTPTKLLGIVISLIAIYLLSK